MRGARHVFNREFLINLENYVRVSEVAALHDVSFHSVKMFFVRRKRWRKPWRVQVGRRVYLNLEAAELYSKDRATHRPKNVVSIKRTLDGLPLRGYTLLHRLEREGKINIIRYRNNYLLSTADSEYVRQYLRDQLPLPGWVPLARSATAAGVTPPALANWLRVRTLEVRTYLDVESHQLCRHLRQSDLNIYLER